MERNVNVQIDHREEAFYSDSISIIYNPSKFILDFKQNTPRIDQIHGKSQETIAVKHRVIILDVKFAKIFLNTLKKSIDGYEKKHGDIKTPKISKTPVKSEVVTGKEEGYIG
ncbi:MAG: DUF3467 domain-containing protein [Candidatus Aenigmatarchaeota archaeon]|nr:MAG: DUF3467 domain-containing protein [Candidatus Aenigmarchaeota archaeon]